MCERQIAFQKIQSLLHADELASLGPEPRSGREPLQLLEARLRQIFSEIKLLESAQPLIRSLVLLRHDHLDESHSISQDIHNADGSFLHGIMHRREPDYGNAKYWFHRVGEHACYPLIAERSSTLLAGADGKHLRAKLIRDGKWDAFAFINECEAASGCGDLEAIDQLQQLQAIESRTLLEHFLS